MYQHQGGSYTKSQQEARVRRVGSCISGSHHIKTWIDNTFACLSFLTISFFFFHWLSLRLACLHYSLARVPSRKTLKRSPSLAHKGGPLFLSLVSYTTAVAASSEDFENNEVEGEERGVGRATWGGKERGRETRRETPLGSTFTRTKLVVCIVRRVCPSSVCFYFSSFL